MLIGKLHGIFMIPESSVGITQTPTRPSLPHPVIQLLGYL